jgi:hypothetical protein
MQIYLGRKIKLSHPKNYHKLRPETGAHLSSPRKYPSVPASRPEKFSDVVCGQNSVDQNVRKIAQSLI